MAISQLLVNEFERKKVNFVANLIAFKMNTNLNSDYLSFLPIGYIWLKHPVVGYKFSFTNFVTLTFNRHFQYTKIDLKLVYYVLFFITTKYLYHITIDLIWKHCRKHNLLCTILKNLVQLQFTFWNKSSIEFTATERFGNTKLLFLDYKALRIIQ